MVWLCSTSMISVCNYPYSFMIRSYEGRCGLPTNFDSTYCYALGYGAGALLQSGKTGLISSVCSFPNALFFSLTHLILLNSSWWLIVVKFFSTQFFVRHWYFVQVGNLCAPVEDWTVSGTALTSLMDVERRHGTHCNLQRLSLHSIPHFISMNCVHITFYLHANTKISTI